MDILHQRAHKHENNACEDMAAYAEKYEQEYKGDNLVKIIIVGAGNRGKVYATYATEHPSRAKVCSSSMFTFFYYIYFFFLLFHHIFAFNTQNK